MKVINSKPREIVLSAVNKYLDLIKGTYGPAGNSVILASEHSVRAVDDGKLVSMEYELENELENAVIQYIREATSKTDDRVGDGTTTSAILTAEILKGSLENNNPLEEPNIHAIAQDLTKGLEEAVKQIKKVSKPIKTEEELFKVAYNSCNNVEIAKLISELLFKIGKDGTIAIEDSQSVQTETEIVNGLELEKGYSSPYFINKPDGTASINKPAVLVINDRIDVFTDILPVLQNLTKTGQKDVLIVAEGYGDDVMGKIILTKLQGHINPILIESPGYGENKVEYLKDISVITGATLIDPKAGRSIKDVKAEDFGHATTVTSRKDLTLIIGGKGHKKDIEAHVNLVKQSKADNKYQKEQVEKRVARLQGGVAVIRVGALTTNEQMTIRAKVDDAVNASKVAFREGVVPGAGRTYEKIKTESRILNEALKAPRRQLEENGVEYLDDNVVDPTEVLIASLETAVSIAKGLLKTGGIIAVKREEKKCT